MAILKHIASKNASYAEIQRYLMFEHDEDTNKPILDENGELTPRKDPIHPGTGRGKHTISSIPAYL